MRAALTSLRSEFHQFLYAPVCHEQEEMPLSVLSALARQDVDPWTEAERLSQLPQDKAVQEMVVYLDALPRRTLDCIDRMEVAGRLCALLPRRSTSLLAAKLRAPAVAAASAWTLPAAPGAEKAEGFSLNWRFLGIYICLMLFMNWLIAQYAAAPSATSEPNSAPLVAAATPDSTQQEAVSAAPVAENSAAVARRP